jgi:DNA-binding transcriptional MerR regulator
VSDTRTYSIGEFANLAGVTVRTLHHYDEAGLLTPAERTASGHRRYRHDDLLRLQQILTLKFLGFSLTEIEALLASPSYEVGRAMQMQKDAIDAHITDLQRVSFALNRITDSLASGGPVDWASVTAIIHDLSADRTEWLRQHFPPETWAWLAERARQMPPDLAEGGSRAWTELIAAFRQNQHRDPADPAVQALAAQMQQLILMFSGGDPEVERATAQINRDVSQLPDAYRGDRDQALQDFMGEALRIYRESQAGES